MSRTRAGLIVAAGMTLLLGSLAGLLIPLQAQEAPPASGGVGGYTLKASAAASRQIFRPENNIIPAESLLDLSIPFSLAELSQGSGRAVGSTVWPGDTLATACRAAPEIPCYPFFAESFYPQGPADAKAPQEIAGTTMSAHSEEKESVGKGEVTPLGAAGEQIGASTSTSTSSIKTGVAVAESVSRVSDIILGAGAIRIESVVSQAKASSDGNAADAVGTTTVQGFTIGGVPVSVTTEGVSAAGQIVPNPLGPAIDPINAALETIGAKISLSKPIVTKEGGKADVIAGGLIISFDNALVVGSIPPEVKANFPIDPQGKTTLVFGQASALADASPGFGENLSIEETPLVEALTTDTGTGDLAAGDSVAVSTDVPASAPVAAPAEDGAIVQGTRASAISTEAVGLGLVLLALAGAILGAAGLKRLGTGMFEPMSVTSCPQEKP